MPCTRTPRPLLRRTLTTGLGAALLLGLPGTSAAQRPAGFDRAWSELGSAFRSRLDAEGVVGGGVAFMSGGRIVAAEYHGLADRATSRPVEEGTIFHWASITKTLTGIAVLQLRDRGLIDLDDPIVRHVPELRAVHSPFGSIEDVTVAHLLSHSAGFRGPTWPWGGSEPWHPHEPTEWSQLVAMMPYTELLFPPGERYSYSNPGIVFLGRAIENLTGEPWEVYVDKNVLRPLGMSRSYFDRTPYHLLPWRSNNYYVRDGEIIENGLDFDTGITVSNGGLNAPVTDMARYLAFLAGTAADPVAEAVLDRTTLEEMWVPRVPAGSEGGLTTSLGLTYFILDDGRTRYVGHTGGQKGFVSFFYVHPESGTAAIAAFNTLGVPGEGPLRPDTRGILADVRKRLFAEIFPLFQGETSAAGAGEAGGGIP